MVLDWSLMDCFDIGTVNLGCEIFIGCVSLFEECNAIAKGQRLSLQAGLAMTIQFFYYRK